jgi:hypothetical protein
MARRAYSSAAAIAVAHFKVVEDDGGFQWELINAHGTPICRSMESFATEDEAVANAEDAKRLISRVPIRRS